MKQFKVNVFRPVCGISQWVYELYETNIGDDVVIYSDENMYYPVFNIYKFDVENDIVVYHTYDYNSIYGDSYVWKTCSCGEFYHEYLSDAISAFPSMCFYVNDINPIHRVYFGPAIKLMYVSGSEPEYNIEKKPEPPKKSWWQRFKELNKLKYG